jgi:hypothetical protein
MEVFHDIQVPSKRGVIHSVPCAAFGAGVVKKGYDLQIACAGGVVDGFSGEGDVMAL